MEGVHLSKITIGGFRGFSSDGSLELAVPTGEKGSGLTLLVGPNNAGKSSVLEALKLAGNQQMSELGRAVRNIVYGDKASLKFILTDRSEYELRSVSPGSYVTVWDPRSPPFPTQIYTVPARRSLQAFFGRGLISRADYANASAQLSADRNDNPNLTTRLIQIVENPDLKKSFDEAVQRLLGPELKWTLDRLEDGQYVFAIDSPTGSHTNDGLGFGILSVFYIVAGLFDAQENTVICVDEPELSMHPQIQRRVADYLAEHASNMQIVVSTHSPYFVDPTWFASGAELARCYVRGNSTRISQLSADTKEAIQGLVKDLNNPHVLGIDAREVFFAEEGVLVVEGQEDVILLRRIAEQLGLAMPHSFFGWGAGGAEKVRLILMILRDLGFEAVSTLLDGDKADVVATLQKDFASYDHFVLPADDIRDKPEQARGAKSGVCTDGGLIKDEFKAPMTTLLEDIAASAAGTSPREAA